MLVGMGIGADFFTDLGMLVMRCSLSLFMKVGGAAATAQRFFFFFFLRVVRNCLTRLFLCSLVGLAQIRSSKNTPFLGDVRFKKCETAVKEGVAEAQTERECQTCNADGVECAV